MEAGYSAAGERTWHCAATESVQNGPAKFPLLLSADPSGRAV